MFLVSANSRSRIIGSLKDDTPALSVQEMLLSGSHHWIRWEGVLTDGLTTALTDSGRTNVASVGAVFSYTSMVSRFCTKACHKEVDSCNNNNRPMNQLKSITHSMLDSFCSFYGSRLKERTERYLIMMMDSLRWMKPSETLPYNLDIENNGLTYAEHRGKIKELGAVRTTLKYQVSGMDTIIRSSTIIRITFWFALERIEGSKREQRSRTNQQQKKEV
jgi:hypothetical protein